MKERIEETQRVIDSFKSNILLLNSVEDISNILAQALLSGRRIFVAGNGGSSTDAQHFSAEFIATLLKNSKRKSLPIISLNNDTAFITAWSNDFDFETIFSRQLEGLAVEGDIFFAITTSGNSKNIISSLKFSKENNIKTVLLTGKTGGVCSELSDFNIRIDSENTAIIQELHILIIHIISEKIEYLIKDKVGNSSLIQ